jgi:carboxypeptidase C (cathepsin A)
LFEDAERLPIDGLPRLFKKTWKIIRTNKDLNLPNERDMVANHRCNEIKEDAYKHVEGKLKTLAQSSEKEITDDFRDQVDSILSEATNEYTSNAGSYKKEIQEKYKSELETKIKDSLFSSFINQLEFIKKSTVKSVNEEIQKIT